jgi:uncharacterized membrane protein
MKFDLTNPRTLATTAIMTALVLALTLLIHVPTPIGGYAHLGDIAVNFAALAFGPIIGLISAGIGTALADVLGGYASFAPLTLVVHGLQGLVVGLIYWRKRSTTTLIAAVVVGAVIVVAGYFIGEALFYGGPAEASLEIPSNIVQELVGMVGILVFLAVQRAYPRLTRAN